MRNPVAFRPIDTPEELASEFNSGWLFGVACGGAAVLLLAILPHLAIILEILC